MKNKEYIVWADALKGFTILLMVMGHVIAWNYKDYHFILKNYNMLYINKLWWGGGVIWKLIYSFHMPLLFFISAYLSYKTEKYDINSIVKNSIKKFQRLMLPYFITGFLLLFVRGVYGYWFLLTLFEYYFVYYLFSYINQKMNRNQNILIKIVIFLVPYILAFLFIRMYNDSLLNKYLDITHFSGYYLFFVFGIFMRKYKMLEKFLLRNSIFTVSVVLFAITFLVSNYDVVHISFPFSGLIINNMMIFCAILAMVYFFHCVCSKLENRLQKSFAFMGKYTLEIYMFHACFVIQLPQIGEFILAQNNIATSITLQLVVSIVFSVIAIIFSIMLARFLSKSKVLSYFILGKGKLV